MSILLGFLLWWITTGALIAKLDRDDQPMPDAYNTVVIFLLAMLLWPIVWCHLGDSLKSNRKKGMP